MKIKLENTGKKNNSTDRDRNKYLNTTYLMFFVLVYFSKDFFVLFSLLPI